MSPRPGGAGQRSAWPARHPGVTEPRCSPGGSSRGPGRGRAPSGPVHSSCSPGVLPTQAPASSPCSQLSSAEGARTWAPFPGRPEQAGGDTWLCSLSAAVVRELGQRLGPAQPGRRGGRGSAGNLRESSDPRPPPARVPLVSADCPSAPPPRPPRGRRSGASGRSLPWVGLAGPPRAPGRPSGWAAPAEWAIPEGWGLRSMRTGSGEFVGQGARTTGRGQVCPATASSSCLRSWVWRRGQGPSRSSDTAGVAGSSPVTPMFACHLEGPAAWGPEVTHKPPAAAPERRDVGPRTQGACQRDCVSPHPHPDTEEAGGRLQPVKGSLTPAGGRDP